MRRCPRSSPSEAGARPPGRGRPVRTRVVTFVTRRTSARCRARLDRTRTADPTVDLRAQDGQRHGAVLEHAVVEEGVAEGRAHLGAGRVAQGQDLALAELVGQGLARPGDVAVDLVLDV